MSSIDERIVSIKFNNSQFEAGIKTTMTSLDGLKKTLNFSAGINALSDLDAAGKKVTGPKLDTTGFNASVKTTVDAANTLKSNLKFDGVTKGLNDLDAAGKKVHLKLDAAGFQAGAKAIVDAASVIKQNLNFESAQRGFGNFKSSVQNMSFQSVISGAQNAARSLGELDLAGKAVSFLPISDSANQTSQSISAMSIAGIAAIGALAFKAAAAGAEMAKSLFIDPAKSGLAEYELNLGSIQTILANTQSKGSTLGDVNAALDELNTYSDKTIYNFAEMAKNIGTFTAAGVDLKTSTASIKGIANLAAMSGSNSEQASTAMYQLSQALSAGKVSLMDWNSVTNAGMGGEVFQKALTETARNQGVAVDGFIKKNGSFRDSLQEGWLTSGVLTETLAKMTGDLSDEQLRAMGYNDEQVAGIQKMAATAGDAATKIKTFTQLTGTLTEITGSGWAQSWKYILGDFEQAKEMWTSVYGVLGDMVQGTADARNKMLREWNEQGGRTELIWAVSAAFRVLMGVLNPIKEAFREVFPATTGKQLYDLTQAIRLIIEALIPGEQTVSLIKNTFKLLFTIIKIGVDIIKGALGVVFAFFKAFATGGDSISGSMKPLTDFLSKLTNDLANSTFVTDFFAGLAKIATSMGTALARVVPIIIRLAVAIYEFGYSIANGAIGIIGSFAGIIGGAFVNALSIGIEMFYGLIEVVAIFVESLDEGLDIAMTRVRERMESFGRLGQVIGQMWDDAKEAGARAWQAMKPLRDAISKMFTDIGNQIKNALQDVSFNDTLDMVNVGLLGGLVLLFKGFFKKLTGMGDGVKDGLMKHMTSTFDSINGVLEQLTGTLGAMQQNLQADTLLKIAIAVGILSISVIALSLIDSGKLTKALVAIGVMVFILGKAMENLDKISTGKGFLKIPFIAASMILLAIALTILTIPVMILSRLSWAELIKGLAGVGVLLLFISAATKSLAKNPANLIATGVGLIAIAIAIKILASAVADLAKLSFKELIKGLIGVAVLLKALAIFNNMTKVNKGSFATAAGLILLGIALKIMASAMADFAAMDTASLVQGMIVIGAVLTMLSIFTNKVANGKDMIKTAVALIILAGALKLIANVMIDFAKFTWEEIAKGLAILVVSLDAISKAMAKVPPNMLTSAIGFVAIAAALKVLASALKDMGGMSWEEIAKGMVTLAGSMIILSAALIMMQGTVSGAAALLVVAVALAILAPVLVTLGNMSWEQIGMGMAALAAVFVIFGIAGLILAPLVPVIFLLGIAVGMLGLGLMGIGIGTAIFAAGLLLIGTVVTTTGPALILFVGSILALIPLMMIKLAEGIVEFAKVIGEAAPVFIEAFTTLLTTLLTCINIVSPQIEATLWMLIVMLVGLIVRGIPLFVDAGMKIIIGILQGIGNNMGQLLDAAYNVITQFIDGISRNIGKIIDSGVNLIISFIEGLAKSVRENSDRMSTAGLDLAEAIIDGMVGGIAKGVNRVITAAQNMAGDALNAAKKLLGINSPSREFFLIGKYVDEGFAGGVDKYAPLVIKSTEGVGKTALSTLKKTMASVGDVVSSDVNMSPVIRPVLDLSAVKKEAGQMGSMFKTPTLSVDSMYNKAAMLSVASRTNKEVASKSAEAVTSTSSEETIIYNQYNSSPKALSNADIYRKTNNQLSGIKSGGSPSNAY